MTASDKDQENVILDDLDKIEKEREALYKKKQTLRHLFFPGRDGDVLLWRRLFAFAKPYTGRIIFCLLLSFIVSFGLAGQLFFIRAGLEPILAPDSVAQKLGEDSTWKDYVKAFVKGLGSTEKIKVGIPPSLDEESPEIIANNIKNREFAKNYLFAMVIILIIIMAIQQVTAYFQSVMIRSAGHRIVMDIRNALFARIMSFSLKFHNKNHSGKLISRLTNDLGVFGSFFTNSAVTAVTDVFKLLVCLGGLFLSSGLLFLGILAVIALVFTPIQAIGRKIRRRDKITQRSTSLIFSVLSESLAGQKIVKAFCTEDYEYEKFRQASVQTYRNTMKVARLRSRTQPVVDMVGAVVISALMYYLGNLVINDSITAPNMFLMLGALVFAIGPIRRLAKTNNNIQSAFASADRVATLLYSEPEITDKENSKELTTFNKEIRFNHIHFDHDQGIPVLTDLDFTVGKGEVVALVGPSGAGKTTLVDLLPRFYDVIKGGITIDGTDIRDLQVKSLRSKIGIVSQETILFNDTVRMNISYGIPNASMEKIITAAKAANAHDFIKDMEDGYDTHIGERGVRLSGGQKQRLAIARAILKNPPILILDEATSSLDSESEAKVQEALFRLMEGRTTLVIAHRLSTVRKANNIIVIKDHKIVESGKHDELLAKKGVYADLHELQVNGVKSYYHG